MLSDEEKEIFNNLKEYMQSEINKGYHKFIYNDLGWDFKCIDCINAIDKVLKQSKEIEELNKSDESKEQSSMKYYNLYKELVDKIKQKDVTKRYENMIQAFECDFNLPFNYNDFTMFDDLKRLIQNKNKRLVKDIELLQELAFGIRYGNLKIIDKRNKLERSKNVRYIKK